MVKNGILKQAFQGSLEDYAYEESVRTLRDYAYGESVLKNA